MKVWHFFKLDSLRRMIFTVDGKFSLAEQPFLSIITITIVLLKNLFSSGIIE